RSAPPGADARSDTQNGHPPKARLIRGIATAAITLLTIPPITDAVEAGPGGGGGRGGGFGGGVRGRARGFAGPGGGLGVVWRRAYRRSRNWRSLTRSFLRAVLYGATGRRRNGALLCQSPCRHARSWTRSNIRQSRHYQHGLAIALRVCAVPRQVLWLRSGHRLDRTGVLALRLLRLFRLCVLAVCL